MQSLKKCYKHLNLNFIHMGSIKQALKSKTVWSGIGKIVAGVGLIATGEQTWQQQIPELLLAIWGIVDIALRFKTKQPIDSI
jgi:hypothetical protein